MNAIDNTSPHSAHVSDTLIYDSERVRVWRRRFDGPPHTLVVKEPVGPDAATRLQREIRILERLRGVDGVPQLADSPAPPGTLLLQDSLGTRLGEALLRELVSMRERVQVMLGLTRITAAVHARGVVHKDINPAHVLLRGADRKPMLVHFELATTSTDEHSAFVHHRNIAGTLAYLAPELTGRTGRSVDQRADLYALGATFYELSAGCAPFRESDPLKLVHDVLVRVPVAPIEVRRTTPRALSEIIMRLLEKEPDRRYQSAEGLAHDLERVLREFDNGGTEPFVLGERDFAPGLLAPPRLVGREAEVRALQTAFRNSLQGNGCSVVVCGAPGVGKTALLNELRSTVTAQHGWFVSGKFDQHRRDMAADAVHQALRALGRLLLAEPESELVALRADILRALGADAQIVAALFPQFELLLGIEATPVLQDPLQNASQLIEITLNLLRAIVSPTRPLALVLDDLQWAGSTPLVFFEAASHEGLRGLLLVGVCRQESESSNHPIDPVLARWRELESGPVFVQLQNLSPAELAALLGEVLRLPPEQAEKLAPVIGERTNGNPYETIELVNALRRDGVLVAQDGGWKWDAAAIRRYIGGTEVVDLLHARIERLPAPARNLLECMACLGNEVELGVLQTATGLSGVQVDAHLAPALDDGLVAFEQGGQNTVRFRHERVQQAVYAKLEPAAREQLRLVIARRLALQPEHESLAAEQYVRTLQRIPAEEYCSVAALFSRSAATARLIDPATAERFLTAALTLLRAAPQANENLLLALETDRHLALCSLGHLDEADCLYRSIERRCTNLVQLASATCVQVGSLSSRGSQREAVTLGFAMLARLGLQTPGPDIGAALDEQLQGVYKWLAELDRAAEIGRAPATEPRLLAGATLLHRLTSAAFFLDPRISFWLALEAQRLCATHGHAAEFIGASTFAPLALLAARGDFRAAYAVSQHVREVATKFGTEHGIQQARFNVAFVEHWFEPLSEDIGKCERLRAGLLREGDLRFACYSHHISVPASFECSATIESPVSEVDAALALAGRASDEHSRSLFIGFRQLLRSLRGETEAAGSFAEQGFDEAHYGAEIGENPMARAYSHINRALCALLFDGPARDLDGFAHHASTGLQLSGYIVGHYHVALAHFLQAMALAAQIRAQPGTDPAERLKQLESCRDWLARRAEDAPVNFLTLLHLVEAEKAWALGQNDAALIAFDLALRTTQRERPWQLALTTERAGRFHLARGLEHTGRSLLREARDLYDRWGATGKVNDLQRVHGFLKAGAFRPRTNLRHGPADAGSLSSDSLDLLAILRASQALSSETSLPRLKSRVVELLGALTGATQVLFISRGQEDTDWVVSTTAEGGEGLSVAEAGACGMLPLSIFRYAERTREPLLLDDATRDDRFSRDPYFVGLECCSLLAAPIMSQGVPRAVLVLENRSSRSAFSADRLDAVMLMAGQLGVSLDNAGRYEVLEQKVSERTAELAHSLSLFRATLESATDAMVAVDNAGRITTCNEHYAQMWGLSHQQLIGQSSAAVFQILEPWLKDPEQVLSRVQHLIANPEEESSVVVELKDGRVFEEYSRPQRIGNERTGRVFCFHEITERRRAEAQLQQVNEQLIEASRQGGMAEVATNVLHNVGNVLTSVNVSATVVADSLRRSRVGGLQKAVTLMYEQGEDLPMFMASDRGKQLPVYLAQLASQLHADQETCVKELEQLRSHIEHIRDIVTMQQTYARTSAIKDVVLLSDLVEDSLRLNLGALSRHGVQIVREFEPLPALKIEKHKVLQVLVNLISNAKYAYDGVTGRDKRITLRIERDAEAERARISVIDNGVGIPEENLTRIFNHGFTTRAEGHGFGLHSSALAAREMGGSLSVHSAGADTGATFILELPFDPATPT